MSRTRDINVGYDVDVELYGIKKDEFEKLNDIIIKEIENKIKEIMKRDEFKHIELGLNSVDLGDLEFEDNEDW